MQVLPVFVQRVGAFDGVGEGDQVTVGQAGDHRCTHERRTGGQAAERIRRRGRPGIGPKSRANARITSGSPPSQNRAQRVARQGCDLESGHGESQREPAGKQRAAAVRG